MKDNDKHTCFDLRELSLFVKGEIDQNKAEIIEQHLTECFDCAETVEEVKSFYVIESEESIERLKDFKSSSKSLSFISYKFIVSNFFQSLKLNIANVFKASDGFVTGVQVSKGANPILRFGPAIALSMFAVIYCFSILDNPVSNSSSIVIGNESNSVIASYQNELKDNLNKSIRTKDGTLNWEPFDDITLDNKGGMLFALN